MSTAVTLAGAGIDDELADRFFDRIRELEDLLSRFRPGSQISRLARGELGLDDLDPAVRLVLAGCEALRASTAGDFDHEPRRRSGDEREPVLDVNAVAKGWIIEDAATVLRLAADEFFVNAGGDGVASRRIDGAPWRVGVQHPADRSAVLGAFELAEGAVATSGTYERGAHIRSTDQRLVSVTVIGPELAEADGLSTAVFASGQSPPSWWPDVDPAYGLLTLAVDGRLRWLPPRAPAAFEWRAPTGSFAAPGPDRASSSR